MSIDDDLQPVASITGGDRALDLFTDRYSFTRLLAERLNDPPKKEILFFHGAGGNGKSLLLKYLRTKVCKGLTAEQWQQAKEKSDDELAKVLENLKGYIPVPTALLDFAPSSHRRDRDPFYGLVRIREELAASTAGTPYRLKFPLHTYGCFLYLQKTNRLSEVDSLFPFEEAELIKEFGDLVEKPIPGLGFAISLFGLIDKYSGNQLARYQKRFRLDADEVEQLQKMKPEPDLLTELPRLLAQDLNVAMAGDVASPHKPGRVVLFFDTHEAFYRAERDHAKEDGWLRRLLRRLDTEAGIVAVVSGRDKPRWAEAYRHELNTQIPADYVCLKSVDDLASSDAEIFLTRAGVEDAALRESLIRYASVEAGRVHPLHLGLCADVVLEAAAKRVALVPGDFSEVAAFQEKSAYLIEQLLKYVDEGLRDAIRALSACRAFNFEIYQLLGEKLSFAVDAATFRQLVGFSFVWQVAQRGDKWYRIHDLLRRLGNESEAMLAHEALTTHYQSQGKIEVIYHLNQLNWLQGIDLWVAIFDESLEVSLYERCRMLLDLRRDLTIKTPFQLGRLFQHGGKYFQSLSSCEEAKLEYEKAIAAYDKYLMADRANVAALNRKGIALHGLANMQEILFDFTDARESYMASIAIYDVVLDRFPDNENVLHNKGNSLMSLAFLQTTFSENTEALESYRLSIAAYDAALNKSPGHRDTLNNKSISLTDLANLQVMLSENANAIESYSAAATVLNTVLEKTPDNITALNHKGVLLKNIASLQVILSENVDATESYRASIAAYDAALERDHECISVMNNKGMALSCLGRLQVAQDKELEAIKSFSAALTTWCRALAIAPNNSQIRQRYEHLAQRLNAENE